MTIVSRVRRRPLLHDRESSRTSAAGTAATAARAMPSCRHRTGEAAVAPTAGRPIVCALEARCTPKREDADYDKRTNAERPASRCVTARKRKRGGRKTADERVDAEATSQRPVPPAPAAEPLGVKRCGFRSARGVAVRPVPRTAGFTGPVAVALPAPDRRRRRRPSSGNVRQTGCDASPAGNGGRVIHLSHRGARLRPRGQRGLRTGRPARPATPTAPGRKVRKRGSKQCSTQRPHRWRRR